MCAISIYWIKKQRLAKVNDFRFTSLCARYCYINSLLIYGIVYGFSILVPRCIYLYSSHAEPKKARLLIQNGQRITARQQRCQSLAVGGRCRTEVDWSLARSVGVGQPIAPRPLLLKAVQLPRAAPRHTSDRIRRVHAAPQTGRYVQAVAPVGRPAVRSEPRAAPRAQDDPFCGSTAGAWDRSPRAALAHCFPDSPRGGSCQGSGTANARGFSSRGGRFWKPLAPRTCAAARWATRRARPGRRDSGGSGCQRGEQRRAGNALIPGHLRWSF